MTQSQKVFIYFLKFLVLFVVFYFGSKAVIGLTVPGGYYSEFIRNYLDYPRALRQSLLHGSKWVLSLSGYSAVVHDENYLRIVGGRGVRLVYSCLGLGLLSTWTAFVLANDAAWKTRLGWAIGGCGAIWLINVARITILLLVVNQNHQLPGWINHHTAFNGVAYAVIFFMGYLYDRRINRTVVK